MDTLKRFIWFGGASTHFIMCDLKNLVILRKIMYFLVGIFDDISQIGPPDQKIDFFTDHSGNSFCTSTKYLTCWCITLVQGLFVFATTKIFKLV